MTAELLEKFVPPSDADAPSSRVKWTRAEVERIEDAGLWQDRKFELLEGELYDRTAKQPLHAMVQTLLNEWAHLSFSAKLIRAESPIELAERDNPSSQPLPDMVITTVSCFEFAGNNPDPSQVALIIEVSDTSLRDDLSVKAGLYARAEIKEYWVIDIRGRRLFAHRVPRNGDYSELRTLGETESIAALAAPDKPLLISAILPKAV